VTSVLSFESTKPHRPESHLIHIYLRRHTISHIPLVSICLLLPDLVFNILHISSNCFLSRSLLFQRYPTCCHQQSSSKPRQSLFPFSRLLIQHPNKHSFLPQLSLSQSQQLSSLRKYPQLHPRQHLRSYQKYLQLHPHQHPSLLQLYLRLYLSLSQKYLPQ
jgi:hypothetical protein